MSTIAAETNATALKAAEAQRPSYAQALKSTASIGGASVVTILLGIVRTKFVALVLGPAGVGLLGAYAATTALVGSIAGMGIPSSGVRQIAEAAGQEDRQRLAATAVTLRRATRLLAILGAGLMAAGAYWISQWTFGNHEHAVALAVLSISVLLSCICDGQVALLQGLRRIGALVHVKLIGALLGTIVAIPLVYLLGSRAIVPLLITVAATAAVTSWSYVRRLPLDAIRLTWRESLQGCRPLLRLGAVFMASSLMTLLVAYLLRVIIMRRLGMEAAGQYQAAANLASVYVGFVLSAMGTDFYPRLTAAAHDHRTMVRMLNEQAEIALLLAIPGILATLAVAPAVVLVFYSRGFGDAVDILRWQTLGVALRVISWPLGFAVLAKGRARLFFCTELASSLVHVGGIWLGLRWFGLMGAGIAYLVLYAFYWTMMYGVTQRMLGFAYTPAARRLLVVGSVASAGAFLLGWFLPVRWSFAAGVLITVTAGYFSANALAKLTPEMRAAILWIRMRDRVMRAVFPRRA